MDIKYTSYLTGSRAYGAYATNNSDYDMVLATDGSTINELFKLTMGTKLMFGNINFIVFNINSEKGREHYVQWKTAHDECMLIKPKTKEEAIAVFRKHGADHLYNNHRTTIEKEI